MSVSSYPTNIYIGITDKCNANCIICWRNFHKGNYEDIDEKILDKISNAFSSAEEIGWWGDGEFFCCGHLGKIFDYMRQYPNVRHRFSTNGQLLFQYADEISAHNIAEIIISVDGATNGTQENIRRGCSLENISKGIARYYEHCEQKQRVPAKIMFAFTCIKSNIAELPMLVDFADRNGVKNIHVQSLKLINDGLKSEQITTETEKQYFVIAKNRAAELGIYIKHEVFVE